MKRATTLLKLTALYFCLITGSVFGTESADAKIHEMDEKFYINPQDIHINENNILVFYNDNWIATNAIYSDAGGVYIQSNSVLGFWTCSRCGALNPPYYLYRARSD